MAVKKGQDFAKAQRQLNDELSAGTIRNTYLFYGDEAYLRMQDRDNTANKALGDASSMNFTKFKGQDTDVSELTDLAQTLPFLAERRVIVVDDSGLFKSGSEELAAYLKDPCESTCLIFSESEVDKRRDVFKALTAGGGLAIDCTRQDRATLSKWVTSKFKSAGKNVSPDTVKLILDRAGDDMFNIAGEIEKLICYRYDSDTIEPSDVREICSDWVEDRIFEMTDAITEHDNAKAFSLYADLLSLGERPIKVMNLLTRQLNLILQARELSDSGARFSDIAQMLSVPEFVAGKYIRWGGSFSHERLLYLLNRSAELDFLIKTGKISDQLAAELLITEYGQVENIRSI